ncbi:hypothetical protein LXL04_031166 [Taraxacum kok-saghyz]
MAATVATADADGTERPAIPLVSVPTVDLRLLSQSELYTLSISSDSSFDSNRCNEVVIPKINRAVFNESAGSRKQTYSRFRLASAESSSTTTKTTTLHRRTPHLRLAHTHPSNNINDPEQAENSQIIRMLKQFCKSDPNFQDVDQMDDENNSNSVVPEFLNPENLGIKRKRGRPRKHENVVFLRPPTAKRIRHNTVKKAVEYDNEMDRELVNDSGVTVNMATLSGLDDPYGPEIRRRTLGMSTEDELLGFLRGMNGQWGSRRRKRRVVDASEFGDVLPKGWKLSLCIKKKEGRVWLFCRRYLSPSGRQFESCREISMYLNSFIGQENLEKQNHVKINTCDNYAMEGASVNAVDVAIQQDIRRDTSVDNPSSSSSPPPPPPPAVPPVPANCEEQVTIDEMEVQVEDQPFKCQVEAHDTTRSELDTPVNDHIECYVENEIEKTEPSLPPSTELDCDPVLMSEAPNNEPPAVVVESCENLEPASHDHKIVSPSKQDGNSNVDKGVFIEESCGKSCEKGITKDEVSKTDQDADDTISQSELLGDEIHVESKLDSNIDQGINPESFMLSSFPNEQQIANHDSVSETGVTFVDSIPNQSDCIPEQTGVSQDNVATTATIELVPNPAVSETLLPKPIEENDFGAKMDMDMDIDVKCDELASEKGKAISESPSGFFLGRFGIDKDDATIVQKLSTKSNRDPVKVVSTETLISPQKQDSQSVHNLAPDTFNNVNKLPSGLSSSSGLDGQFDFRTNDFASFGASLSPWQDENKNLGNDVSFPSNKPSEGKLNDFQTFTNNEPKHNETVSNLEFCSLIPSENDQEFGFQDCLYERAMEECKQDESSERGLLDHFSIADTSDDIFENKMYSTPLDGIKFDEDSSINAINSNELSLAFGNPYDQKKDLVIPTKIDESFDVHTDLSMVNSSMVEELKGGRGGLFNLGNKFTSGFGTNHTEVMPDGGAMWKNNNSTPSSHAQMPYPSSFHSFNIMSGKGGDGEFRVDERYNEGFGVSGIRSGRPEPVEFSFLTARSQHPHPHPLPLPLQGVGGDSRVVFPYNVNVEMEQQFDSPYWIGKNSMNMMANTSSGTRNQIGGVVLCGCCRNEFHIPPTPQNGIPSLCPSCTAIFNSSTT